MLTSAEAAAIKASWIAVAADPDRAGIYFFDDLFAALPQVKPLFKHTMSLQVRKLMETLAMIVASVDDFARLVPIAEHLGRAHVGFGAKPEHYPDVRNALIAMLRKYHGGTLDSVAEVAWTKAYGALSGAMIRGSQAEK